jgi:hypothetical protein
MEQSYTVATKAKKEMENNDPMAILRPMLKNDSSTLEISIAPTK